MQSAPIARLLLKGKSEAGDTPLTQRAARIFLFPCIVFRFAFFKEPSVTKKNRSGRGENLGKRLSRVSTTWRTNNRFPRVVFTILLACLLPPSFSFSSSAGCSLTARKASKNTIYIRGGDQQANKRTVLDRSWNRSSIDHHAARCPVAYTRLL